MANGDITQDQLDQAIAYQKQNPDQLLGEILVKQGFISEKNLVSALGKQFHIPFTAAEDLVANPADREMLLKLIPEEVARKYQVLPLSLKLNYLTVALSVPGDLILLDNLRKITGFYINPKIAIKSDLLLAIQKFYGEGGLLKSAVDASYKTEDEEVVVQEETAEESLGLDNIIASTEKAPVIRLTDLLIRQAIKERASDIHIEPFHDRIKIRYRIDGVLHDVPSPAKSMALPLISRLKIISKLDISERRLPQDGNFRATIDNRDIDFRVSTIPTIHGEKMVMRILDRSNLSIDLSKFGFDDEELTLYRKAIHKPYGMILITGPTGSGKTTTLYGALNELNDADKNITTVEDPVEYQIAGINQVQVKPSIGLTFAAGLRAFLRQDPDIMLVGEIRDLETAQVCVKAAMTGHLVFSTLHTNDAPSAINRLIDIGVEPFLVISSLIMVAAQRLVRTLCPKCKEAYKPNPTLLPKNFKPASGQLYKAHGCAECAMTGYRGRAAIFELMMMNDRIEQLVARKAPLLEIREEARKTGMRTLEESGYRKVNAGETSLEEIIRITVTTTN